MSNADFLVEQVFDVKGRGGLLVVGQLLSGSVAGETPLRNSGSGHQIRVLGVEFHSGGADPRRTTLVIDRRDSYHVNPGDHLIGSAVDNAPGIG